jgi:hypothetical protein
LRRRCIEHGLPDPGRVAAANRLKNRIEADRDEVLELLIDLVGLALFVRIRERQCTIGSPAFLRAIEQRPRILSVLRHGRRAGVDSDTEQPQPRSRERHTGVAECHRRAKLIRIKTLDVLVTHQHTGNTHGPADDQQQTQKAHRQRKAGANRNVLEHDVRKV